MLGRDRFGAAYFLFGGDAARLFVQQPPAVGGGGGGWSVFTSFKQVEALLGALHPFGEREGPLRAAIGEWGEGVRVWVSGRAPVGFNRSSGEPASLVPFARA